MTKVGTTLFVSASLALVAAAFAPGEALAGTTVDAIKARGKVICGANGNRPGWSSLDSQGQWQGLDVDTCRAVAAAVLGDANKVQFVKATTQTRFTILQSGEVDLLTANVTWTLGRDSKLGLDFVAPTFYDGQGFMVPRKLGVKSVKDLDGATVCVLPGSTSERVAADVFRQNKIAYRPVVIGDQREVNTAFFGGRCDVQVQSTSGLSSTRAAVAPKPEDYVILPGIYGKDPMGPVVRQGDAHWRDVVAWVVYAMIEAEEAEVSSQNVDRLKASSPEANVQRLLGVKDKLGEDLGLDNQWAYRVIKQVGNYAEVFERNVGKSSALKLDRGINTLWTKGGLMYSPPFQ